MKVTKPLMIVIVVLLLIVDWLTFHDIAEPHSLRDWLMFLSSLLIFFYFAKEFSKRLK